MKKLVALILFLSIPTPSRAINDVQYITLMLGGIIVPFALIYEAIEQAKKALEKESPLITLPGPFNADTIRQQAGQGEMVVCHTCLKKFIADDTTDLWVVRAGGSNANDPVQVYWLCEACGEEKAIYL